MQAQTGRNQFHRAAFSRRRRLTASWQAWRVVKARKFHQGPSRPCAFGTRPHTQKGARRWYSEPTALSVAGQASAEALVAAVILLITLLLVISQAGFMNEQVKALEANAVKEANCTRLVSAVNLVGGSELNSEMLISISFDANLANGYAEFAGYYCRTPHIVSAALIAGNVRVRKSNGVLSVENY